MGKLGKHKREERTLAKLRTAYERKVHPLKRKLARQAGKTFGAATLETEIYRADLAYMVAVAQIKLRGFLKAPAAAFARQVAALQSNVSRAVKCARAGVTPETLDFLARLARITPEERARLEDASARVCEYLPPIAADLGVPLQAFRDVRLRDVMKDPEDPRRNPYPPGTPAHTAFNLGRKEGAAK